MPTPPLPTARFNPERLTSTSLLPWTDPETKVLTRTKPRLPSPRVCKPLSNEMGREKSHAPFSFFVDMGARAPRSCSFFSEFSFILGPLRWPARAGRSRPHRDRLRQPDQF